MLRFKDVRRNTKRLVWEERYALSADNDTLKQCVESAEPLIYKKTSPSILNTMISSHRLPWTPCI
uniref:Uncharacterized protein n=1 Tax=Parascaris equorum TaxID=6256 RepID=A0A914S889_PAREQ